jgi:uncharacterized protein YjbI with pentapeptide repeats
MYRTITDKDVLEQLTSDKELKNADLRNADIIAVTMNLENAKFEGANLEGANLADVNLYNAYLDGANFTGANLESAYLEKAIIRNANFTGANLKKAVFENIRDFRGTHFNGAYCNNISFIGSQLTGGDFTNAHFENSEFYRINFSGAHLNGAQFVECFFQECDLSEADLQGANFTNSNFEGADIIGAHLENANFSDVHFLNVYFENSFLEGANFQGVSKENTELDMDSLSEAQRQQLGITIAVSLIEKMIEPNPDIPSLIELIMSDNWNPEEVHQDGKTALMIACLKGMEDVALALIASGKSNMYLINDDGDNAFKLATEKNLIKVLDAFPKNIIDIRQTGFDTISQEDVVISDYLKQNPYNLVLMINNSYYFTSKDAIKKQINNPINIKYGCKKAGEQSRDVMDENIMYDITYFSLSSLFGLQILIQLEDAKKMMDRLSGNMFILRKNITLPSIISQHFIDGGEGMSADHCQSGKATDTYIVFSASADCGINSEVQGYKEEIKAEVVTNIITVSYKEGKYSIPMHEGMNVEELKRLFLEYLKANGIVDPSRKFNVRFIFKGKILDDGLFTEIKKNPSEFIIQAMVNSTDGGKKTKRAIKKKKTMKKSPIMKKKTMKKKLNGKKKTMKKKLNGKKKTMKKKPNGKKKTMKKT